MAHILSVSYDESLLRTRGMLLTAYGYQVTSTLGFTESLKACGDGKFDLFILGHSIPDNDKKELVRTFREHSSGLVISLRRGNESPVQGADYHILPDPEPLMALVEQLLKEERRTGT
jgi:DNA-binding response OmpR family regulator